MKLQKASSNIKLILYSLFFTYTSLLAQESTKIALDINYAVPNIWTPILKEALVLANNVSDNDDLTFKTQFTNPLSIKADYFISPEFSFGLEGVYASNTIDAYYPVYETIQGIPVINDTAHLNVSVKRYRLMARAAYHFVHNEKIDAYVGFGFGVLWYNIGFRSENVKGVAPSLPFLLPAARLSVGCRYFFIPNVGINGELGILGGGLIGAGVTIRF